MSGCNEWTSQLSVFRLIAILWPFCRHRGMRTTLNPGAEPPTAHHELIPVYAGLHPLQKEIRIEIRNRAFENCFNRFLYWIGDPDDFRSNTRLGNRQHEVRSRNPLLLRPSDGTCVHCELAAGECSYVRQMRMSHHDHIRIVFRSILIRSISG
jgi:hypothetical protein